MQSFSGLGVAGARIRILFQSATLKELRVYIWLAVFTRQPAIYRYCVQQKQSGDDMRWL